MKMNKNLSLARVCYIACVLCLILGIAGFVLLNIAAKELMMPKSWFSNATAIYTLLSSGSDDIVTYLFALIIQHRSSLITAGLILAVIQAWLKYDAGVPLSFLDMLAFPTGTASTATRSTPVTPIKTVKDEKTVKTVKDEKTATSVTSKSSETHEKTKTSVIPEKKTETVKLTVRMGTSKTDGSDDASIGHGSTAEPGKSMKRLGDL